MQSTIEFGFSRREDQVRRARCPRPPARRRGEGRALADDVEQRRPVAGRRASASGVEPIARVWLKVAVGDARGLLGALDVAADPVERLRHAAQHRRSRHCSTQVSLLPPPWLELTTSEPRTQRDAGQAAGQHRDSVAARSARTGAGRRGAPRACPTRPRRHEGGVARERDHRLGDVVARVRRRSGGGTPRSRVPRRRGPISIP